MAERRSLVAGLQSPPPAVAPSIEKEFVYRNKPPDAAAPQEAAPPQKPAVQVARVPISTRIKAEFAQALKRASLERQLAGTEPSTLQDILEEAVEPWLKAHGYLT